MANNSALIVEDDETVVAALQEALTGQPVELTVVRDASTAVTLLREKQFCGVVVDLILEEGSGFDVLRHIHRHKVAVPTVVVTHRLPTYVREMLTDEHVKLVVPKPVDPKLLGTIVLGLCGIQT